MLFSPKIDIVQCPQCQVPYVLAPCVVIFHGLHVSVSAYLDLPCYSLIFPSADICPFLVC